MGNDSLTTIEKYLDRIAVALEILSKKVSSTPASGRNTANQTTVIIDGEGKEWQSGKGATYKVVSNQRIPTGDGGATKYFSLMVGNKLRKYCVVGQEVEISFSKVESREYNGKRYYSVFADDIIPLNRDQAAESDIQVSGNENDDVPF